MAIHLCGGCRRSLPRTDEYFHANARRKDGLACWCKDCMRALSKAHEAEKRRAGREHQERIAAMLQTAKALA